MYCLISLIKINMQFHISSDMYYIYYYHIKYVQKVWKA